MDLLLFESINSLAGHNAVIDGAFVLISNYGQFALLGLLLLLWLWPAESRVRQDRQRTIIIAVMSVALALLVNQVIIHLWNRPRPFIGHPDHLLLPASKEPSFPSDHSTFGFAIAAALLFGAAPLDLPALLIAGLLAFSRIYTGEHYVSDVIAGALTGGGAAFVLIKLRPRLEPFIAPLLLLGRRLHLA
jgi:undecaprenyl-diphosphatase